MVGRVKLELNCRGCYVRDHSAGHSKEHHKKSPFEPKRGATIEPLVPHEPALLSLGLKYDPRQDEIQPQSDKQTTDDMSDDGSVSISNGSVLTPSSDA